MKRTLLLILLTISLFACKVSKVNMSNSELPVARVAKAVIYKTYKNFDEFVPVIMDVNKTQIISYPHPKDVILGGKLALPTPLKDGFLLDNRGINANIAFTSYTYEEYAALSAPPSMVDLLASIIEKNPLVALYDCGNRNQYTSLEELKLLVDEGFPNCEKANIRPMQVDIDVKL